MKVYEVNAANYYRENRREIDTDIQLDGLTPNWEETFRYETAPLRRASRLFEFPQLTGDGVYVIDFIGSGKSSRVVVRRGALRFVSRMSVAGQLVTVLDEQNQHVRDGTLELEGRTFRANERGEILIPLSTNQLEHVQRFSLLVLSDEQSAEVRETEPPAR